MDRLHLATLTAAFAALLGLPVHASADDAGKSAYEINCASCHGASGKGDGPVAVALNPPPRDFTQGDYKLDANSNGTPGEDEDLKLVIKQGAMMFGGSVLMAGWPTLDDALIDDIIVHIRSLEE